MGWPGEAVRRRADEHKLGEALLATEMAVDHPEVALALVSDSLHRWTGRRRYFPAPALDAIWEHASALPRWQDAGTTRDNAERRLRASRRRRGRPRPHRRHPSPPERDMAAALRADGGLVEAAKPT